MNAAISDVTNVYSDHGRNIKDFVAEGQPHLGDWDLRKEIVVKSQPKCERSIKSLVTDV